MKKLRNGVSVQSVVGSSKCTSALNESNEERGTDGATVQTVTASNNNPFIISSNEDEYNMEDGEDGDGVLYAGINSTHIGCNLTSDGNVVVNRVDDTTEVIFNGLCTDVIVLESYDREIESVRRKQVRTKHAYGDACADMHKDINVIMCTANIYKVEVDETGVTTTVCINDINGMSKEVNDNDTEDDENDNMDMNIDQTRPGQEQHDGNRQTGNDEDWIMPTNNAQDFIYRCVGCGKMYRTNTTYKEHKKNASLLHSVKVV